MDWQKWLKGLVAAVINGLASGVILVVVEPATFNLEAGFSKLWHVSILLGLLGAANYLKSAPVPADAPETVSLKGR